MHELTQAAHSPLQCTAALSQILTRYRAVLRVTTCMRHQSVADTDVDESQAVLTAASGKGLLNIIIQAFLAPQQCRYTEVCKHIQI